MACPNVNLESWKLLVSARGEDMAYYLWEKYEGEVPESESKQEIVKASIKATDILQSDKAVAVFSVLAKNKVTGEPFWKKLQADLGIPKEQMELLKSFNTEDRNELVTNMLANYSYAIEINTANKQSQYDYKLSTVNGKYFISYDDFKTQDEVDKNTYDSLEIPKTKHYSNLTVPGGTNYTENEIATPEITPAIKGHAQFATDKGIGWFRSDDKIGRVLELQDVSDKERFEEKTRRILEVQSDLFQKGRNAKYLIAGEDLKGITYTNDFGQTVKITEYYPESNNVQIYVNNKSKIVRYQSVLRALDKRGFGAEKNKESSKNQFLQLLNKDNNWVTFFVKSIIQDSVKKGYDKVLFPAGDTAAKVEGHESVKDFIKDKQKRLDRLESLSKAEFFTIKVDGLDVSEDFETRKEAEKELKRIKLDDGEIFNTYEIVSLDKFGDPLEDHSVEIAQLKTEIEDAEAGEMKLSSISGFYENMVQNVLNKQYTKENIKRITDEYDNEWFELSLNEDRDLQRVLFQMDEVPGSTASPETLEKIKQLAKKVGISIEDLADYAKKTGLDTKNLNGVADLVRGVVAIATGREEQALTEEVIHLTTAILEQTNPQLVTSMLAKIDRFKIYKQTLDTYKNNKNYQLSNGKPDIRKIKKEAVDKLLVEVLINQNENETEFPELMQEENVSMVQKWWRAILDFIKGIYTSSNIDIFEEASRVIMSDANIGTVSDIEGGETFYQIKNDDVDKYYDQVMNMHNRSELVLEKTDAAGNVIDKRHYVRDGERVAQSVTEKISKDSKMPDRTEADKLIDRMKADWGDEGHDYIEDYIINNLIDENGYARPKDLETKISTKLSPEIQKQIRAFVKELIASYKPGTRFIIEKRMVNEKVKGMLASTIDFMAIEPDDKTGIKVDTLDWKFSSINKNRTDDIPWYKQKSWKEQMGEYTKMHYAYGIKPNQIRKARMVPFILNYKYNIPGSPKSGLYIQSIEVGKLDSVTETKLYLLPVPVTTESTGVDEVDRLLASLRQQYEKMYKLLADPEKKYIKNIQLNQLSKAIRTLHLQLDFKPLAAVAKQFLENADKAFKTFEGIDYSKLSKDEIEDKLGELLQFKNSAEKYATIDETYLATFPKEGLDEEGKKILTSLERVSSAVGRMMNKIQELQNDYVVQLAVKEGITTEETKEKVLNPEKEITAIGKTFLESSKLASRIINLASSLVQNAKSLMNIKMAKTAEQYSPILLDLEKEATAKGKSAFDMIGTVNDKGLSLIKKIDSKFWEAYRLAIDKEDKKFFLENMDVEEYNKLAKNLIEKGIEELNKTVFSTDPEGDFEEREYKIMKLKDSLDINSKTFNGYDAFDFDRLFKQTMKEDKHLSKEYKEMAKSPAALRMWTYMVGLNDRARKMGYLTDRPNSFFPLIEASLINKLLQTKDLIGESKDFFKDLYTVKVNEEQNFSKLDPETHQLKKEVPRLFLRTDKEVGQLSKDLNKVLSLWTRALIEYDTNSKLENTLLTLHHVEKAKGHIIVDEKNEIVYEGGAPKIDLKSNKNADVLQTITDDALYGLREDPSSLGNATLDLAVGKFKKDEDEKETTKLSIKKGLENSNKLTQALAVGLKALIAIPNYFGVNMHAFIQAGSHYNFGEFQKNNAKVTTGVGLSTIDKALLHEIVPLNEDISKEKMREIAKKQGLAKWLGTWTFNDVMMITNSWPEKKLQLANAKSFNDNAMVVNGKIVNIRQHLRAQDREKYKKDASGKYIMSEQERKNLENTFEERVANLKETKSLPNISKIEDDHLVIPGVTDEEIARYRNAIIEYSRELNGQMSENNKAGYRRDSLFKSFMMFKNWIPKMIISRTVDVKKNVQLDQWQYGRTRVFVKTWAKIGLWNIGKMRAIIQGTDEGLAILDEMLQTKKEEHLRKTGEELEITQEEFYDMMRQALSNQAKELGTLLGIMILVISASASQPPEDATELEKNRYKFWMKAINKISDELAFYYNPLSFESITKGSVLPSLGLLSKTEKIFWHLSKETYGYGMGDEDIMKNAHPTKYFLNIIPVASQFQNEILPIIDAELAKELGVRVSAEARQR